MVFRILLSILLAGFMAIPAMGQSPLNTDLQTILSNDSTWQAISTLLNSLESNNSSLQAQVVALQSQLSTAQATISQEQAEEASEGSSLIFDALERSPWLLAGGTVANSVGVTSTATATQSQTGVTTAFFNIAPNAPWANAYWYKKLGPNPAKTIFKYELSFLFATSSDANASQAVEFETQQVIGGIVFNLGWQFDFADNALRVWNRNAKAWVATGTSAPRWQPNTWMSVVVETHRDSANVYYDAITINGNRIVIDQTFPAPNLGLTDMLNCAVQLDGNGVNTAYRIYIDDIKLTVSQ